MQSASAESVRVAYPLFQAEGGGSSPTSALQLFFRTVNVETTCGLNKLWHSRLPLLKPSNVLRTKHSVCYAAEHDGIFYATAVWSSPVARLLPQDSWLELRRFAIAPDAPRNTASRMLAWMARAVHKRFPEIENLISYQDMEAHCGTIYKAAGWCPTVSTEFSPRDHSGRSRAKAQSTAPKQRWEKKLCQS
jgi:hypothetical protein